MISGIRDQIRSSDDLIVKVFVKVQQVDMEAVKSGNSGKTILKKRVLCMKDMQQ